MPSAQVVLTLANQTAPQLRQTADEAKQLAAAEARAQQAALTRAQAVARLQVALGQNAAAEQTLSTALAGVTTETIGSIRVQTQLAGVQQRVASAAQAEAAAQNQAAQATQRAAQQQRADMDSLRGALTPVAGETNKLAGAFDGLQSTVGAVGIGIGIAQLTSLGIEAGKSALSLRETQNSLRAIAGDTATYNQVMATARQQQILFGGSLEENIKGLTGLTITSRQSGASLKTLTDLSQRLGVLDPEQGAGGARVALSEALSGDPTSLARRYEIPRAALAKLRDTTIPVEERLKVIDSFLNKVGITSDSVAGKVDKTAATYRGLAAAADTAKTSVGGFLADAFAPVADASANVLQVFDGTTKGFGNFVVGANNLSRSLSGMPPIAASTEASIRSYADSILGFVGVQQDATAATTAATAAAAAAIPTIEQLAEQQRILAASSELTGVRAAAAAVVTQQKADADKLASIDTQTHAIAEKQLDDAARAAADAMVANGVSGAAAAALLAKSSQQIDLRTVAYYNLEKAALAARVAENAASVAKTVATNRATGRSSGREGGSDFAAETAASVAATKTQTAATEKTLDAQIALAAAKGQTGKQIDLLRQKEQLFGKDSADRMSIEAQIISLQERGGKSRSSALTKELGLHESIYDSINKQKDALLDVEELEIKDRQTDRDDVQKIKTANAIIAALAGRTDARAEDLRGRAQDSLALISVQDRKRAQELAEKGATAGGTIGPNGRLLQSQPGGGAPAAPGAPPVFSSAPSGGAGAGAAPIGTLILKLVVDGKELAVSTEPYIMDALLSAVRGMRATKGA